MAKKTKIYTILVSPGYPAGYLYYGRSVLKPDGTRVPKSLLTNKEVIRKLEKECGEVEFIVREPKPGWHALLDEIVAQKDTLDGVLIFGAPGRGGPSIAGTELSPTESLAFTGLPTVFVQNLLNVGEPPYKSFKRGRVISSILDRENITSPSTNSGMFNDLLGKIRLIEAIKKMKEAKMLYMKSPSNDLFFRHGRVSFPRCDDVYRSRLKETLGTEIITRDVQELIDLYKKIGEGEARKIAKMWIDESKGIRDTREEDIVESAKIYLALDTLVKEYDASALLVTQYAIKDKNGVDVFTALPMMEFAKRGVIGCYQEFIDTVLSQLLGYYMSGKASFHGDNTFDPFNDTSMIVHCGCPVNAWGDKNLPYTIRDYTGGKWSEELKRREGAVPAVELPVNIPATIWQIFPAQKEIFVYTGESIPGDSLYNGFEDIVCRDKLVVRLKKGDVEKVMGYWSGEEYGAHRAVILGDWRQRIKQLGTLLDFDVIEQDR
jgi:hypothetical protein